MDQKTKKTLGYVFAALIIVGLVLVIIGLFVGEVVMKAPNMKGNIESESIKLFEKDTWGQKAFGVSTPSNAFAIISFIVAMVGLVVLAVDAVLKLFVKKNIKFFGFIGAGLAIVGAILVLVSGLVAVNGWWDALLEQYKPIISAAGQSTGAIKDALKEAGYNVVIGAGVWLGFIGGLVGGAAGLVGSLKAFN